MINIHNLKKVHFVGIGGIGSSALAYFLLKKGVEVTGSDIYSSEITDRLRKEGVHIHIGPHKSRNFDSSVDLMVYSPAIEDDNPEISKAKSLKIPVFSYPEVLGLLTKEYKTIAVSGSHGKSTTTSLIGLLLQALNLDPTVIVGTKLKEFDDLNCRIGKSNVLVIEADEFAGSFLNYWPKIAIITNIEKEHMDYFKSERRIISIYSKYLNNLRKNKGILIANKDLYSKNYSRLGFYNESSHNIYKKVIDTFTKKGGKFRFYSTDILGEYGFPSTEDLKKNLQIPGNHNISNACAALKVAQVMGIDDYPIRKAWGKFSGAWRRFEVLNPHKIGVDISAKSTDAIFISDYGHHPTEIRATIKAVRDKFGNKTKIICVYQPHQYQRTHYLFNDFIGSFDLSDTLILLDVYSVAGRESEEIKKKVNSRKLAEAIKNHIYKSIVRPNNVESSTYLKEVRYMKSMDNAFRFLRDKNKTKNSIVLIMGAGDIIKLVDHVKKEII